MSTDALVALLTNADVCGDAREPERATQELANWLAENGVVVLPADHPLRTAPFMQGALWELALATALREARIRRLSAAEVDNDQLLEAQIAASVRAALTMLREY